MSENSYFDLPNVEALRANHLEKMEMFLNNMDYTLDVHSVDVYACNYYVNDKLGKTSNVRPTKAKLVFEQESLRPNNVHARLYEYKKDGKTVGKEIPLRNMNTGIHVLLFHTLEECNREYSNLIEYFLELRKNTFENFSQQSEKEIKKYRLD